MNNFPFYSSEMILYSENLVALYPYSLFSYVTLIFQCWKSLETVIAAECQALTLQSLGNLKEAQELLERCLDSRRALLPEDHIQIAANLLHLARVKIVKILAPNKLKKSNANQVRAELDMTKDLLSKSISVARENLVPSVKEKRHKQSYGESMTTARSRQSALIILLQSLDALSSLEMKKLELEDSKDP
ncbi:uncharacterized protein LOC107851476 isoform X4 [Capsicum annuum]|uniref:uncharacterized protein LOC107851476 isoform X4 n=1 Tax=Capsicum annuum TaxID=4072 RepID=UPI001FB09FF5|nr:uncharacterized protein LOC107851476 isoform X4 [Capsicum annuum]XP_047256527.1 uncharacterized protein LOC107851476 isoform X4 [Capsicum annuum]